MRGHSEDDDAIFSRVKRYLSFSGFLSWLSRRHNVPSSVCVMVALVLISAYVQGCKFHLFVHTFLFIKSIYQNSFHFSAHILWSSRPCIWFMLTISTFSELTLNYTRSKLYLFFFMFIFPWPFFTFSGSPPQPYLCVLIYLFSSWLKRDTAHDTQYSLLL